MRLISINLNKRLNDLHSRRALLRWLSPLNATVLAVQEPGATGQEIPEELDGLFLAAGNENVACYLAHPGGVSAELLPIPAVIVELDSLVVCNTYLAAHRSSDRTRQIHEPRASLLHYDKPVIVVGDFNLAPLPTDGLYGEAPSPWTT